MPKDAFAFPFRKPSTRNRFAALPLPGADASIRPILHARTPDAGPSADAFASTASPSHSPPWNGHDEAVSGSTGWDAADEPAELRKQALRLLDLEFLAGELRDGRGDLLLESFRAVRQKLVQAGEDPSRRLPWAARFVSRKSQTIWDSVRIEREIRRIQRHPTLLDRLREMETFLAREWIPLTRHAAVPGFFRRHLAHCAGNRGIDAEGNSEPARDAPLFLRPGNFPDRPHFPALIGVLDTGTEKIVSAAAAADGSLLLTVDGGQGAALRCGTTGRIRQTLTGTGHRATAANLSEDGRWAAVRLGNGRVAVWDTQNGGRTFSALCGGAFRLSGNGRRLMWQGPSGHLLRQDLSFSGSPLALGMGNLAGGPQALALSRDGRWAVSAPRCPDPPDSKLVRASQAAGERRTASESVLPAGSGPDFPTARAPSTLSRFAISVWDLDSGQCLHQFAAPGNGVRFLELSPDGRTAVSVGDDRELRIWDRRSGQPRGRIGLPAETTTAIAITPCGRMAVTAHSMGTVLVWDLLRRRLLKRMQTHFGSILEIALVRGGKRAFALGGDGRIRGLDLQRGEPSGRRVHRSVQFLETSPDGQFAIGAGCLRFHRRELRIWELPGGSPVARSTGLAALPFRNAAISPRGNLALTVQPGSVRGWNLPSGDLAFDWKFSEPERIAWGGFAGNGEWMFLLAREQYLFAGPPGEGRPSMLTGDVLDLAPFPDSRHLLTLAGDRGLEIWNLLRGVRVGRLPGSRDVRKMVVSPGGNWLVEIVRLGCLRVRNLRTGRIFFPLGGRVLAEPQIRFSPDGHRLAIGGETRHGGNPPESRVFSLDLGGAADSGGPGGVLPISLPFRRPIIRITPDGRGLAAAEPGGREVHLFHLETGRMVGCATLPADSPPLTHWGDFGAGGLLPAALQDGRVVFFGVGQGYEAAGSASAMEAKEMLAMDRRRKGPTISPWERKPSRRKNAPPISLLRQPRKNRRGPVIYVSREFRTAISTG